jgi:hypothetical protein
LRAHGTVTYEMSELRKTYHIFHAWEADPVPARTVLEAVLPLSVSTHGANHHEVTLVQLSFDFYMLEAKPENLIGDKAYDSDAQEESLKAQGVDLGCCHLKDEMTRRSNFLGEPSLAELISGNQTSEGSEKPRKALPVETRCLDLDNTNA